MKRASSVPARSRPGRLTLEICVASAEDAVRAEQGGADRIELNSALMLGGLTPSFGAVREARAAVRIPIIVMIRPRAAGFCYSRSELSVMRQDLEMALSEGADGIAFGILTESGGVDVRRCREIVKLAAGRETVFHRAFDVVPKPLAALEKLVELGVTRVMTSGQEASAYNGAANIASYIRHAAGRIEILPAGGINRFTLEDVLRRTGCDQVHASLSKTVNDRSTQGRPQVFFGGTVRPPEDEYSTTNIEAVRDMRRVLTGKKVER